MNKPRQPHFFLLSLVIGHTMFLTSLGCSQGPQEKSMPGDTIVSAFGAELLLPRGADYRHTIISVDHKEIVPYDRQFPNFCKQLSVSTHQVRNEKVDGARMADEYWRSWQNFSPMRSETLLELGETTYGRYSIMEFRPPPEYVHTSTELRWFTHHESRIIEVVYRLKHYDCQINDAIDELRRFAQRVRIVQEHGTWSVNPPIR